MARIVETKTYGPYRDSVGDRTVVTLKIQYDEDTGRTTASFQGEEYRKHSSHPMACGQAQGSAPRALVELWDRWHLNGMRSACAHQRALGWTCDTHPAVACPECGFRLGTAWLYEELPGDFVAQCDRAAAVVRVR